MKKSLNVFSTITAVLVVVGALFKIMHWPGAAIMMILSLLFFSLGFIPAYAFSQIKSLDNNKIKFIVFLGYFCGSLLMLFLLAKIQHWSIGGPIFVITMGLFSFIFVPFYTSHKMRASGSKSEKWMHFFAGISMAVFALGWAFKVMHYPFTGILLFAGVIVFVMTYLPYIHRAYKQEPDKKSQALVRVALLSILITTLIAFVFSNAPGMFMNSFALTQETIEASSENLNSRNKSILNGLQKADPSREKAERLKSLADNLCNHIKSLKSHLIATATKMPKQQADSLSPFDLGPKDNYDIPTAIMIGGDLENPKIGNHSAIELKNKIIVFREDILSLLQEKERLEISKHLGLNLLESYPMEDMGPVNWEIHTFFHVPLASVLTILSQLQNDVRVAENSVMTGLQYESLLASKNENLN